MIAALNNAPPFQDEDLVGVNDGGETVGDDQAGAVLSGELDLGLDGLFGDRVERGGGLVEDQNGRIFEQGAGDGDALFFTPGEL